MNGSRPSLESSRGRTQAEGPGAAGTHACLTVLALRLAACLNMKVMNLKVIVTLALRVRLGRLLQRRPPSLSREARVILAGPPRP